MNNILQHKIPGVIDKMVKNNIIGLIHQEFMDMPKHSERQAYLMLEALSELFRQDSSLPLKFI